MKKKNEKAILKVVDCLIKGVFGALAKIVRIFKKPNWDKKDSATEATEKLTTNGHE
jgi:hypothetical protein